MSDFYIRLYEKTKRSVVGDDLTVLGLWAYLLLSASAERKVLKNGEVLEPGDCIVSCKELAEKARCSTRTMQRLLKSLEKEGMIAVAKVTRNGTHLSICNFRTYQPQFFNGVAKVTRNGTQTMIYNNNNTIEDKGALNSATRARRFSPPSVGDVEDYIAEKGYSFDAESFIAHYEARDWFLNNGRKMADWKAACVTWHKNSSRYSSPPKPKKKGLFD